jgi:hypothetical protein
MQTGSCSSILLTFLALLFGGSMFAGSGRLEPTATLIPTAAATVAVSGLTGKMAFVLEVNE